MRSRDSGPRSRWAPLRALLILMVRGWRLQHIRADARLGGYVRQFVSHVIAPDAERL